MNCTFSDTACRLSLAKALKVNLAIDLDDLGVENAQYLDKTDLIIAGVNKKSEAFWRQQTEKLIRSCSVQRGLSVNPADPVENLIESLAEYDAAAAIIRKYRRLDSFGLRKLLKKEHDISVSARPSYWVLINMIISLERKVLVKEHLRTRDTRPSQLVEPSVAPTRAPQFPNVPDLTGFHLRASPVHQETLESEHRDIEAASSRLISTSPPPQSPPPPACTIPSAAAFEKQSPGNAFSSTANRPSSMSERMILYAMGKESEMYNLWGAQMKKSGITTEQQEKRKQVVHVQQDLSLDIMQQLLDKIREYEIDTSDPENLRSYEQGKEDALSEWKAQAKARAKTREIAVKHEDTGAGLAGQFPNSS